MGKNRIIGERVKALRETNELTVEQLAERCGLDKSQVLDIEERTEIPSIAPLIIIARSLGVRLGTFLDDQENLGPVVCRKEEVTPGISFSNSNIQSRKHMTYQSLSNNKSGRHMEPFMIDLAPQTNVDFVLSSHEGEEFILVMDGCVEITYGDQVYNLSKGDSIYYDSIVPHVVNACKEEGAKILAVIYTPI